MALPTEADLQSEIRGDIDRYYQAKNTSSEEKIRLFRLAWDIAGSSFGSRQELYERFFFGDPVRMAGNLYNWYDKEPYKERIRKFLHQKRENDEFLARILTLCRTAHVEYFVRNLEKSRRFYVDTLGLVETESNGSPDLSPRSRRSIPSLSCADEILSARV